METVVGSAFAAAFGAGFGAYCAYCLAVRQANARETSRYLALLLFLHEQISATRNAFLFDESQIIEIDGERGVEYWHKIPEPEITMEQIQFLMEKCPEEQKDMLAALLALKRLCTHTGEQVSAAGRSAFSEDYVRRILDQMNLEMVSIRAQYRKLSGKSFPIDAEPFPMQSKYKQE